MNGPVSTLCLGEFTVDYPGNFELRQLESASAPDRCEYPSITHDDAYLYIVFQREDRIYRYKMELTTGNIINRIQLSEDGRLSHHPYVDAQANGRVNYVWEDSTADNIDIYWQYEDSPFLPENISNTVGKSQWPQICRGTTWLTWSECIYPPTDHNWDIYYKDLEYPGYQNLSQTPVMSQYSHGVVIPPGWPPPYESELVAIWTEGNHVPYEIRAKSVVIPTPAYFYVDAGKINSSPWTIQRQDYIQFSPDPEKTIDYHPEKLIYRFSNLHPGKRYRIKLVFYYKSSNPKRWRLKINGDNILHANIKLNEGEITVFERILPPTCYKDSTLYLNIEKMIGDYALVSQIFIYGDGYEGESISNNTNGLTTLLNSECSISIHPNPFQSRAVIQYSLPADVMYTQAINIYDASGRRVKQINCETINQSKPWPGILWNGTDDNANTLPNGVYFAMFDHDPYKKSTKIIIMR